MYKNFQKIWPWIVGIFLSLVILRQILPQGIWYTMHDSTHPFRLYLLNLTIGSGQFPPIWADYINGGYGYPLFHFYAPLFNYLASFFNLFGYVPNLIFPTTAIKLTLILTTTVGVVGVMKFARRWGIWPSLVSGVIFALSPYVAVNIFVRGAYSEYLSMALIPWLFLSLEDLSSKQKVFLATIISSLFLLSHNLIPILVLPFVTVWTLLLNRKNLRGVVLTTLLTLGITSWFLIPLVFERSFVMADQIAKTTDYARHFLVPWQLWNSTWGFGGSVPGVEDGMSFKLGKIGLVLTLISFIYALYKKNRKILFLVGSAAALAFLGTDYSRQIWQSISILQLVQFPWRSLGPITVLLAITSGYSLLIMPKLLRPLVGILIIFLSLLLNLKYFSPQSLIQSPADDINLLSSDIPDIAKVVPEFKPSNWHPENLGSDELIDFVMPADVEINDVGLDNQGRLPLKFALNANFKEATDVSFGVAYYPTWIATIDGKRAHLFPDNSGLASLHTGPGSHEIEIKQGHTMLEKYSYLLTICSLLGLSLYMRKQHVKA